MNSTNPISEISDEDLLNFEKNLTWTFTSVGAVEISNWLFSDYANIVNELWLGQHLGIITDRRGDEIVTNFELHQNREHYLFCEKYKNSWLYFLRKLILGRLFVQYGNTQKPIIVNELPSANFASNILTEATPNAKVLIFVRDGLDVVNYKAATLLSVGKRLQIGLSNYSKNNKLDFLKMESRKWAKMTSILLDIKKNHHESLVKLIKFEDFCENPIKKISEIFEFVGIKTDQSKLSKFTSEIRIKISSQELKFSNRVLSQEEKDVIENIMKKNLRELKYY